MLGLIRLDQLLVLLLLSVPQLLHLHLVVLVLLDHVMQVAELLLFLQCFSSRRNRVTSLVLQLGISLPVEHLLKRLLLALLQLARKVVQVLLALLELLQ